MTSTTKKSKLIKRCRKTKNRSHSLKRRTFTTRTSSRREIKRTLVFRLRSKTKILSSKSTSPISYSLPRLSRLGTRRSNFLKIMSRPKRTLSRRTKRNTRRTLMVRMRKSKR